MHTLPARNLVLIEFILRNRADFFQEIRDQVHLGSKIQTMFLSSAIFFAIYGAVMGVAHSPMQALSSAVKLPLLFLLTFGITTPSLHFFNILFGARQTLPQTMALILTGITTTAILLVSFAPITLFFLMSSSEYTFFKLLNVGFFALSGAMGIIFLYQGAQIVMQSDADPKGANARFIIFALWAMLYGFVGTQMAWTLSPFIGQPGEVFILVQQVGGNFYTDVMNSLTQLMR